MKERLNKLNILSTNEKIESNNIHSKKKVGYNNINQDVLQQKLKDKSYSL